MRLVVLLLFSISPLFSHALEGPETIELKTKTIRPQLWYSDQATLWKQQVESKSSEDAWINYYAAARYAQYPKEQLIEIENQVNSKLPSSFAANLISGWNRGFGPEAKSHLDKAFNAKQDDILINALQALQYEYDLDAVNRKNALEKLWHLNGISISLLNYSYNVLMSLETNAILFSEAENTTLPLFFLQDVFSIRKDVVILNLDMLENESYRQRKLIASNLKAPSDVSDRKDLCEQLPKLNDSRNFYYPLTLSQKNLTTIKDKLYVVGLASKISNDRMDNISLIKSNVEKRFMLDYLTVDFNGESEVSSGKVLSANYLVPMLLLSEHYKQNGETEKNAGLEQMMLQIAAVTGKTEIIETYLNRDKKKAWVLYDADLNPKHIEGKFRKIKGTIYASEHEVTNAEYQRFLDYVTDHKVEYLYDVSKIDLSKYEEPALSFMRGYHLKRPASKKDKFFTNYPIVNISYEGALAYCEWLTAQYLLAPERKYKKVKFRLPDVNEWQVAAAGLPKATSWNLGENSVEVKIYPDMNSMGGKNFETKVVSLSDPEIKYPWFKYFNVRNTVINQKGCALGNFKFPPDQKPCQPKMPTVDGFMLMSPVQSYFPNDVGLYDVVGNVAEMTSEKGKACGGSWNHSPEESTIKTVNRYEGPDSAIGFRVFMEVIEE
jgi:hypothetical protein